MIAKNNTRITRKVDISPSNKNKKKQVKSKKKKKVKKLNTERLCIEHARGMGWLIDSTERWIPYAHIKKDLYGFIDLLAIDKEYNIYGIQTTSYSNMNARIDKILNHENYERVKNSKIQITVWAWKKITTKGKVTFKLIIKDL